MGQAERCRQIPHREIHDLQWHWCQCQSGMFWVEILWSACHRSHACLAAVHTWIIDSGIQARHGQKGWLWAPMSYTMPLLTSLAALYPLPRWYLWLIEGSDRIKHSVLMRPFHTQAQPADWLLQSIFYFSSISWINLHVWVGWILWTLHPSEFLHACQKMGSSTRGSSTGM